MQFASKLLLMDQKPKEFECNKKVFKLHFIFILFVIYKKFFYLKKTAFSNDFLT